jgi:hypothetical protein
MIVYQGKLFLHTTYFLSIKFKNINRLRTVKKIKEILGTDLKTFILVLAYLVPLSYYD